MISSSRYPARREKLRKAMKKDKLPAVLICSEVNVRYLTGFTGDSSWLLLTADREVILSDGRFTTQLEEECPDIPMAIRPVQQTLLQLAAEQIRGLSVSVCGFEATAISYDVATHLEEAVDTPDLIPVKGLVEPLRAIKDPDEIREIREAIRQAEKGFDYLKASLTAEMTELTASFALEEGMRRFGAICTGFDSIIAVGERAALPHARPGLSKCNQAPFLLVDWGARTAGGYVSDLTRMIITGSISSKLQRLYEVVKKSQQAAIEKIRPGVAATEVDRAARAVMEQHGVADHFNHGLGHGFGLQVHESTRLSPNSADVLSPGMVITVEPGVYYPGWGGIRLEDDILVTRDGHEVLSSLPRELESHCLRW